MYSFGPLPRVGKSGRIIGAHQKIDRIARREFESLLSPQLAFPAISDILQFEGINGPDGVKLKSPGVDEPWHFIDPNNPEDTTLVRDIIYHQQNLIRALAQHDTIRAAFEAAWLAHAVVDGLTPAHQTSHTETLKILREETQLKKTLRSKLILPGDGSPKQFVKNNWHHWGAGGVMTAHTLFEAGVATTIQGLRYDGLVPPQTTLDRAATEKVGRRQG